MDCSEKVNLKRDNFQTITNYFEELRGDTEFCDVTLVCDDGVRLEAHKIILAASSMFFRDVLKQNHHPHPLLFMRGVAEESLEIILEFIYKGEVIIAQDSFNEVMMVAKELKIEGMDDIEIEEEKGENNCELPEKVTEQVLSENEENKKEMISPHPSNEIQVLQDERETIKKEKNDSIEKATAAKNLELDELINTMIGVTENNLKSCKVCGQYETKVNKSMRMHIESRHIGVTQTCGYCGKTLRTRHALGIHKRKFHRAQLVA